MSKMWKAAFWEARGGLVGWAFGFSMSALLIKEASIWFWIIESLLGLLILFIGFLVARRNEQTDEESI